MSTTTTTTTTTVVRTYVWLMYDLCMSYLWLIYSRFLYSRPNVLQRYFYLFTLMFAFVLTILFRTFFVPVLVICVVVNNTRLVLISVHSHSHFLQSADRQTRAVHRIPGPLYKCWYRAPLRAPFYRGVRFGIKSPGLGPGWGAIAWDLHWVPDHWPGPLIRVPSQGPGLGDLS